MSGTGAGPAPRVVLVSGLSGAGKASILRALEDLGFEAVDNPPLPLLEALIRRKDGRLAVVVDARTRGFDAGAVLDVLRRVRAEEALRPELVFAWADETAILRRFTETRRRHPLAPLGRVTDGIRKEETLTAELKEAADLLVDTTDLAPTGLRQLIETRFGADAAETGGPRLNVTLVSFAYSSGLPREADLVFDARFLRNPHYDPILRPCTGLDPDVCAYVEADRDFAGFFTMIADMLKLLLPRFVQEGKKYATVAIGCTGGRHRSVCLVERIGALLADAGWAPTLVHRELAREAVADIADRRKLRRADKAGSQSDGAGAAPDFQAQEA